jgi:hypothetical protein
MKKALILMLIAGLVAGSMVGVADAKKKKKRVTRTSQGTYQAPATAAGNCTQTDGIGCMTIPSGSNEKFLTAKVTDAHGQPVAVSVQADLDGDMFTDVTYGVFCGETEAPIEFEPGASLIFWVGRAADIQASACVPGMATQGTLDVTFSNVP